MRVDARPVPVAGAVASLLAVAFLLAPPLGTDLAAQVARADFVREAGFAPVDLRWYGGTVQYGYSLLAPAVMAVLGPRLTGALAAVGSTVALTALFVRCGAARPLLGGVLAAGCFFGNLASGRVTYALGAAFGLLGLLALTIGPPVPRRLLAAAGAALAAATSPVAGLFAGLAGVALLLASARAERAPANTAPGVGGWTEERSDEGSRRRETPGPARAERAPASTAPDGRGRWLDGAVLACAAAVPIGLTAVLSDVDGRMNISTEDLVRAGLAGLVVAVVVPRRAVRIGALLSSAGVLAAYLVDTPVGLNATRLASMFALPVLAALAEKPRGPRERSERQPTPLVLAAGLVVLALLQPPVEADDVVDAGNPTASAAYFTPLLAEVRARGPVGRIEIPPMRAYWDAAHAAREVQLARGWLRQADITRNGLFFDGTLSAETYRRWLQDNGVAYVAVPDTRLSWVGRAEAALIRGGLPYLTPVWRSTHWTLYQVDPRPSYVEGGTLVAAGAAAVTVDVPAPGELVVKIRHNRWLRVTGPPGSRLAAGRDGWTVLRVATPGRYTIRS